MTHERLARWEIILMADHYPPIYLSMVFKYRFDPVLNAGLESMS